MNIIVRTQAEWEALPKQFKEFTVIEIRSDPSDWIQIKSVPENSRAVLRESSRAELWGSSRAVLWGSSRAVLWGSSSAVLRGSSRAVLWGSSSAVLRGSSSAELRESSRAELRESSRAELWESSSAVLRGSSRAVLWGSSSAVLRESSSAVLRESSRAELRGSSRAVLWGTAVAHAHSCDCSITIASFAVAILLAKARIVSKSKTATVVKAENPKDAKTWCEWDGAKTSAGKVILFKRVSKDFKTQEGTRNETLWAVGSTLEHPNWSPKEAECGEGKFHACSFASACDEFRDKTDDRYIAIEVAIKDTFFWKDGSYPHKIAFRKGKVLHECNRWGEKMEAK